MARHANVLIAAAACLCVFDSRAQVPADELIEEIQVTATRRPVARSDVASAVTVIDSTEIRGLKLATDALAARPGVFLQQTTPGQGAAIIRGLKGSEILHMVDGLRMNNAIFRNAPTQYLALISPGSVERIEILRGSPASLYGSDAVGGVLQVVNRMPEFDQRELGRRAQLGAAFDTAEGQRSINAAFDVGNDRVAALFSADYLDTDDRRIGGGERVGPSGYSARSFRAAVTFNSDENSSWLVDAQYGRQPKTPRVDELVPGFGQTDAASDEFFFAPNERSFLHLRHTRANGWFGADWRIDAGWQQIVDDRINRDAGATARRLEDNRSDLFGIAVTANGDFDRGSWIAGVEIYHDEVSSRRVEEDLDTGATTNVQSRFPDGSTVDQAAIFANADYQLGARSSLSGGLRFSSVRVDLTGTPLSLPFSVDPEDISADLGWRYELTNCTQLVANVSYGFRAPNVFDLGTLGERPGNRFNLPNVDLESERITQMDAGIRHRGDRFSVEAVLWRLEYSDRIVSVLTGEVTPGGRDVVQTRNRASASLYGLEAFAQLAVSEAASVELLLNYTRGEQDDALGMAEPADRVPPLNGRLSLRYAITDDWQIEPFAVFAGNQDRLSARDLQDPRIDPQGTDSWATANVRATWSPDDRWFVRLSALNVLDERYRVHGSGIDAPGRNLKVDVNYRW